MEFEKRGSCEAQWNGIHLSADGHINLCCMSIEEYHNVFVHIDDIDDLAEYFVSQKYIDTRNLAFNKNPLCNSCILTERVGGSSARNNMMHLYQRFGVERSFRADQCIIKHLDINFSNLCNQQCVMCNSGASSKWVNYDKNATVPELKRVSRTYTKWTTEENLNKLFKVLQTVELVALKGGEPLIQPDVYRFLRWVLENENNVKNIQVVSNFQEISDDMMNLLYELGDLVDLTVSLDGLGKTYNWVRGGNFEKTMGNIRRYVTGQRTVPKFGYTMALNKWTLPTLVEDLIELEKINANMLMGINMRSWCNLLPVFHPRYTSAFVLPREQRIDIVNDFERTFGFIEGDSMSYKSLRFNHLDTILAFENDSMDEKMMNDQRELSRFWELEIDEIRRNSGNV